MNIVITIDEDKSVDASTKFMIDEMTKLKQWRKSSKDKNVDRILTKFKGEASKKRQSIFLEECMIIMDYSYRIRNKLTQNHNYINK